MGAETLSNERKAANVDITIYLKGADGLRPQFFRKWGCSDLRDLLTRLSWVKGYLLPTDTSLSSLWVLRFSLGLSSWHLRWASPVFLQRPLHKHQAKETLARGRNGEVCVAAWEAALGKRSTDIVTPRTEHSREFVFVGACPMGCQGLGEWSRLLTALQTCHICICAGWRHGIWRHYLSASWFISCNMITTRQPGLLPQVLPVGVPCSGQPSFSHASLWQTILSTKPVAPSASTPYPAYPGSEIPHLRAQATASRQGAFPWIYGSLEDPLIDLRGGQRMVNCRAGGKWVWTELRHADRSMTHIHGWGILQWETELKLGRK